MHLAYTVGSPAESPQQAKRTKITTVSIPQGIATRAKITTGSKANTHSNLRPEPTIFRIEHCGIAEPTINTPMMRSCLALTLLCLVMTAVSQPGTIDLSFDPGAGANGAIYSLEVQPDGKILIAGSFTHYDGTPRPRIARLNADGSLDAGFNPGAGIFSVSNGPEAVSKILVEPDGRIVIAGYFSQYNLVSRPNIARLYADGTLDPSFDPGAGTDLLVKDLERQPDGKYILVGSFNTYNGNTVDGICRVTSSGTFDPFVFPVSGDIHQVEVDGQSNCIVRGDLGDVGQTAWARFSLVDGTGGSVVQEANYSSPTYEMVLTGDDEIVYTREDPLSTGVFKRYAFYPFALNAYHTMPSEGVRSLAIQQDERVVVAGSDQGQVPWIRRLKSIPYSDPNSINFAIDSGFGPSVNPNDLIYDIRVLSDGKILIVGRFTQYDGVPRGRIARLNGGTDDDNDGIMDDADNCPGQSNADQLDVDGDGAGNVCDDCPADPNKTAPGICGCGVADADTDNDGTADCNDGCPTDPGKVSLGTCGCGVADTDTDGDGSADCIDPCPYQLPIPSDHGWATNGDVYAMEVDASGDVLYIGGQFSSVGRVVPFGTAVDTLTGAVITSYPLFNGQVNTVIPDGSGGWLIGGDFTEVGGEQRLRLARLDPDGGLHPWNPGANAAVLDMELSGGTVYLVGAFTMVGGQTRNRAAAVDVNTGALLPWNPDVNGTVFSFALGGGAHYLGGEFTMLGGQSRNNLAEVDAITGEPSAWDPNPSDAVRALLVHGDTVFVGGQFLAISEVGRNHIAAIDAVTGIALPWNPNANAPVYAMAISDAALFVGGNFTTIGGQARSRLAAIDLSSGSATTWDPDPNADVNAICIQGEHVYIGGLFTNVGGLPRQRVAHIDKDTGMLTGWDPSVNNDVRAIAVNSDAVFFGGSFTRIHVRERSNLAAIHLTADVLVGWSPTVNGIVHGLAVAGNTLYVAGEFTSIDAQAHNRIAAVDVFTGDPLPWEPNANNTVLRLISDGSVVYAGGLFTNIGGQPRNHLAALNAATGEATAWDPNVSGTVRSMQLSGSSLLVGGDFGQIGGQSRPFIGSVDRVTGQPTPWSPAANAPVRALAVSGSEVYVGGEFTSIGGQSRSRVAAIDASTGAALAWDPGANGSVRSLCIAGNWVYAGGDFTQFGGQPRNRLASATRGTGTLGGWDPGADQLVRAMTLTNDELFVGGEFNYVGNSLSQGLSAFALPEPDLSTSMLNGTFCAGSGLDVAFVACNAFSPGNVFTAQLSDVDGAFGSPVDIGSLSGTGGGTISCVLPVTSDPGTGYRIRVVASSPQTIGADNGEDISISADSRFFADVDGDGFGDPATDSLACAAPAGFVADSTDCDDADAASHETFWFLLDEDGDGVGWNIQVLCAPNAQTPPPGHVAYSTVVDNCPTTYNPDQLNSDGDIAGDVCEPCPFDPNKIYPGPCGCGVVEVAAVWYADMDQDGYGDPLEPRNGYTCENFPFESAIAGDCNDYDASIHPGMPDIDDGIDNDCDGFVDVTLGDYRTRASGGWTSGTVWQRFNGTAWVDVATHPTFADGRILIRSGHMITAASLTVDQFRMEPGSVLNLNVNVTLTVADGPGQDLLVQGRINQYIGGLTLNGQAEIASGGEHYWTEGTITGTQPMLLGTGSNAYWTGVSKTLQQELRNQGTIHWSEGVVSSGFGTGLLRNMPGGVLNTNLIQYALQVPFVNEGTWNHVNAGILFMNNSVTNSGTLNITNGQVDFNSTLTNTGAINVAPGRAVRFHGTSTLSATTALTGSGNIYITGGTTTWSFPFVNSSFTVHFTGGQWISSTTREFTSGTVLNWQEGTIGGSAPFVLGAGSTANLYGVTKTLQQELLNHGTIHWTDGTVTSGFGTGLLRNMPGGVLNTNLIHYVLQLPFVNEGTWNHVNAGILFMNNSVTNSGTLNITNGQVDFNGTLTNTGAINVSPGRAVRFHGTSTLSATTALTGSGNIYITGGTTTWSFPFMNTSFTVHFTGGQWNSSTTREFTSGTVLNWQEGTLGGSAPFVLGAGSTANLVQPVGRGTSVDIHDHGTIHFSEGSLGSVSSVLYIQPGGVLNTNVIQNALQMTLVNDGTWNHVNAGILFMSRPVTNNGTLNVNNGQVNFNTTSTHTGVINVAASKAVLFNNPAVVGGTVNNNGLFTGTITAFTGGTFTNNGSVTLTNLPFAGTAPQTLAGTGTINTLTINNSNGITLGGTQTINTNLTLTSGKVTMGNNSLLLGTSATLTGGSATNYLITNGTGVLRRRVLNNATNVLFPVGRATSYLPVNVQLTAGSTADDLSVRVLGALSDEYNAAGEPVGGVLDQRVVQRTWVINEGLPGGSNATLQLQWNAADEGPSFNRTSCTVMRYDGADWVTNAFGAAGGIGPYSRTLSGITAFGPFGVADDLAPLTSGVQLQVRVLLDGPYDAGTGLMNDGLRILGLVPTTEPYTGLGYPHAGGGGGESTSAPVLAAIGNDAIVDWVVLELRDQSAPATVLATRSALVQRDGDVVDIDGASPVLFSIAAGNYHVAVRHRNHLGCMTAAPIALGAGTTTLDLTTTAASTYGTNARKNSGGLVPAQVLWSGDVTFDYQVQYTGAGNDRDPILVTVGSTTPNNVVGNTYSTRDVNMNGEVKYTGSGNDRDPILVNVGSTTPNNVRVQQLP